MCRVWGISYGPGGPAAEPWTPEEIAQLIFPALVKQGPHAWGYSYWTGGDDVFTCKAAGRCDTKKALSEMTIPDNAQWIIGHTRWATHGSPDQHYNNHPIVHGNIIGVHNGVIRNYKQILARTGRQDKRSEVDSEAIFAAVSKWGPTQGFRQLAGDMVACYVDMNRPEELVLARSHGRPCVIAHTPAGSLIWASEEQAIEGLDMSTTRPQALGPYRYLTIKAGAIVRRKVYEEHRPFMAPDPTPPSKHKSKRQPSHTTRMDSYDKVAAALREANEMNPRRGDKDGTEIGGLVLYNGVLCTPDEYVDAVREEMGYDW